MEMEKAYPIKIWGRNKRRVKYGIQAPANNQWGFTLHTPQAQYAGGFCVFTGGITNWEIVELESIPKKYREEIQKLLWTHSEME